MTNERYDPHRIEAEVRAAWEARRPFETPVGGEAFYCLEMFPYPSGKLHMGHVRNYSIGDAVARLMRMRGKRVVYPMGFDAFGLPAENAARDGNVHPREWTEGRIREMTDQMRRMGFSYSNAWRGAGGAGGAWGDGFLVTCRPEYYRWNQWFFLKFHERGLVERREAPVNWCPACATVLANEQVHGGYCWRHGDTPVETRFLSQWFLKITAYADRLLDDLDRLSGWPEHVKEMQRNWIGRSSGARLTFPVVGSDEVIEVFTTRPDTVWGITYLVIAPEHPIVARLVPDERRAEVERFRKEVASETVVERTRADKPKRGLPLGREFVNPFTGKRHPILLADYVLLEYGTGCVMAVPAHDARDFAFARAHDLPVVPVIHPPGERLDGATMTEAFEGEGEMAGSGPFDGLSSAEARERITEYAQENGWGERTVQYRLRDWLISRQRYWGTPIPAAHCEGCGAVPVSEKDLPVLLPDDVDFAAGGNPLATSASFVRTKCPACGKDARRETDTMDTFVDSSWYWFRYLDPRNGAKPFEKSAVAPFLPVHQYIGGIEHACMHLIYARFFTKVLYDMGLSPVEEPFERLLTQGMVTKDGAKMSKSLGNTVDPGEIIEKYGADTARLFILFAAPPERELDWSDEAVEGCYRFLRRFHDLTKARAEAVRRAGGPLARGAGASSVRRAAHEALSRAERDLARYQFNTTIAALMEATNELAAAARSGEGTDADWAEALGILVRILAVVAPYLAEHLWSALGGEGFVSTSSWPALDDSAVAVEEVEIPVQVGGKVRARVRVPAGADEAAVLAAALAEPRVREHLGGKDPKKTIYREGKILNLVV